VNRAHYSFIRNWRRTSAWAADELEHQVAINASNKNLAGETPQKRLGCLGLTVQCTGRADDHRIRLGWSST
jgi:hypothetical protein